MSSKPSNLDCRDSGESFDAHIVAVCKIFEKGRGFCRAPALQWVYSILAFCRGQVKRRAPAVQTLGEGVKWVVKGVGVRCVEGVDVHV